MRLHSWGRELKVHKDVERSLLEEPANQNAAVLSHKAAGAAAASLFMELGMLIERAAPNEATHLYLNSGES